MGTIVGLFESWGEAKQAIEALRQAGFRDEEISVVGRDHPMHPSWTAESDLGGVAAFGAAAGGFLGGLGGLVVGLGLLTIPGIGPALAAGPLSAALTGGALGVAAGGLIGALVEHGIPAEEARDYQAGVDRGAILVTVNAPAAREAEARVLLRQNGMRDLDEHRRLWEDEPGYRYDSDREAVSPGLVAPEPRDLEGRRATSRIDEDHEGLMLAGGATGAVLGGVIGALAAGPVGSTVGVAIGAAAGGAAGVAADFSDVEPSFYDEWERDPIRESVPWEHAGPAYRHGWEGHDQPGLQGKTWDQAHPDLQQRWNGAPWTTIEPMVRSAWDRRAALTGVAHGPAIDPPADGPTGPEPSLQAIPRRSGDRA